MNKIYSIIFALTILCFGSTCLVVADDSKVDWAGETFLNVTYKHINGRDLKLDIYMPEGHKLEQAPVIYFVHGGGWCVGNKSKCVSRMMLPVFQKLSNAGFVGVSISYRLCKKGNGVVMRDCVTDAMDGLRFLKKNAERYGIDPDRVVVWGDSAGGQLAQMLTVADPDAFKGDEELSAYRIQPIAGISWYGPTDFTDVELFKSKNSQKGADRFGKRIIGSNGSYKDNQQAYKDVSPYYWIKKSSPPLFLLQGDNDTTIPLQHALHLKEKADSIGAEVEMLIVNNSGHNWRKAGGDPVPSVKEIQLMTVEYALKLAKRKEH